MFYYFLLFRVGLQLASVFFPVNIWDSWIKLSKLENWVRRSFLFYLILQSHKNSSLNICKRFLETTTWCNKTSFTTGLLIYCSCLYSISNQNLWKKTIIYAAKQLKWKAMQVVSFQGHEYFGNVLDLVIWGTILNAFNVAFSAFMSRKALCFVQKKVFLSGKVVTRGSSISSKLCCSVNPLRGIKPPLQRKQW